MIFVSNYNYSWKKDVYKLFFFPNTNFLNSNRKLSENARCCLSGLHRYYCVSRGNRTYLHVIWSNFLYYRQNYRKGLLNCTFVVKLKHVQQNEAIIDDDNDIMKGITSNDSEKKEFSDSKLTLKNFKSCKVLPKSFKWSGSLKREILISSY